MTNMIVIFLTLWTISSLCTDEKPPETSQDKPEENNALTLNDKKNLVVNCNPKFNFNPVNENKHTIHINNHDPEYPCVTLFGYKLMQCMACQSPENLKKNFKKLNVRAAKYFLYEMSIPHYQEFFSYFSEQEWQEYWQQLSEEDQKTMPKTAKEQADLIPKMYKRAYELSPIGFRQRWAGWNEEPGSEKWWKEIFKNQCFTKDQSDWLNVTFEQMKAEMYKFR